MRTQSISTLSENREWLAEPVDPRGWLTGTTQLSGRAGAVTDPGYHRGAGGQPETGEVSPAESVPTQRPQRRLGRVDRFAELGGARVASPRRRRRRVHARRHPVESVQDYPTQSVPLAPVDADLAFADLVVVDRDAVDLDADVDGYRMGRWARLALTLTVLTATAVAISLMLAGSTPHALVDVTVGPGDSLWSIAVEAAPDSDPRSVVEEIKELNGITSDLLPIGVVLRVPAAPDE